MHYEMTALTDGMPAILAPRPNTPRMAIAVAMRGGVSREKLAGTAKIAGRLLEKGTERRSAEELAREMDERAIDVRPIVLADSLIVAAVFLNRELDTALGLLEDILFHSTFADFEKERDKLVGETQASLDHPGELAHDLLSRAMFADHPYGHSGTRVLEEIGELQPEDAGAWYYNGLNPERMNLVLVGDFAPEEVAPKLSATFANLAGRVPETTAPPVTPVTGDRLVTRARANAQQAQVLRGWYAPPVGSEPQAAMTVMNLILGGAGLSSRLFLELRDKQGLAYSVRSQYLTMRQTGEFVVAIGTSPENIARARQGFAEQIDRMQQEPITPEELDFARGRLGGSFVLGHETNSQYCLDMAVAHINGLPPDYSEQLTSRMQEVTIPEVQAAAQTITAPSVTAIVAREDALPAE
jgi:predicted Zn-dependent peptidase